MFCISEASTTMREALENVCSVLRRAEEDKNLRKRVSDAISRCGNVHKEDEKITFYNEGILPTTRVIVGILCESQPNRDLKFEYITSFAGTEGEAVRDRTR